MRSIVFAAAAVAAVVASAAIFLSPVRGDEVHTRLSGPTAMSDGFSVGAVHGEHVPGETTLVFGTFQEPGSPIRCSYVLALTDDAPLSLRESAARVERDRASAQLTLPVAGSELRVHQELAVDRAARRFGAETLTIDGRAIDLADGRVFLVNASTLLQVQATLPDLAPAADGAAFVTAATGRLREALRACPELAGIVR